MHVISGRSAETLECDKCYFNLRRVWGKIKICRVNRRRADFPKWWFLGIKTIEIPGLIVYDIFLLTLIEIIKKNYV